MAIKAWIGEVSGLPSLLVDGPGRLMAGDRLLTVLGEGQHLVADALAAPGVPITYQVGAESAELTRPVGDWYGVHVASRDGRSIPGLIYVHNSDPLDWSARVARVGGVTRWALRDEPVTGEGVIVCSPSYEAYMWWLLQSHNPITLVPTAPTDGVPPRTVVVNSVARKRLWDQDLQFTVKWTEFEPQDNRTGLGAVPVTTWGEWSDYGESHPDEPGWQAWSALEVARRVQGMP